MAIKSHVGLLTVNLFLGACQSLKDKRMVVKSLKDKAAARFNVSVAELDGQDKWQVASLGFAIVGADSRYVEQSLQSIVSMIEDNYEVEITDHEIEFF
jgi:uncharacterized protein YlxP (DUF503 family)